MKKSIRWVTLGLALMQLAACVSPQEIQTGLNTLVNKPVQYAITQLGYPDRQLVVAGSTVYVWDTSNTFTETIPQTSFNNGVINGPDGISNFNGTSTAYVSQTVHTQCIVSAAVNRHNIVTDIRFKGDLSACASYAKLSQHP